VEMTTEQLNTVRQWFNCVEDLNPRYLKSSDYMLYIEILNVLGMRVSNTTESNAKKAAKLSK